jgi:hypothetical protein
MFPDWMLERYAVGELDPADAARLEAALGTEPGLRSRLEALRADTLATLAAHPPELVARVVARRLADRPAPAAAWRRWAVPALALSAVAVAAVLLVPSRQADEILLKGDGPSLTLYRLGDAGPERLQDGAPARQHDVVQVAFDLAGKRSLVVVSIDGSGNATVHYPPGPDTSVPPALKALPQSFELDDAPGYERFFLVAADRPLATAEVVEAARRLARRPDARTAELSLPPGAVQRSVRLEKVR